MSDDIVAMLRNEASRDIPDDLPNDTIGWLKYAADEIEQLRAELAAERESAEILFKSEQQLAVERDGLLVRAENAEAELAALRSALVKAGEVLEPLIKASARLSIAAQTTGGVAGRDEGLCAEIDRIAQPLGSARATLTEIRKLTGGSDEG